MSDRAGLRPGEWLAIALAAASGLAFLVELHERPPQVDDAYISYRYAVNLVEGNGLVFNPGERVEGFTNLLWTLAIAAGVALGVEAPAVAHGLGLLSGLAALTATFGLARALLPRARAFWAGVAPWLVYSSTPFARWSTSGLETPLFAAAGAAALAAGRPGWTTAAAMAATLTRPEGALLAAVLFAAHLWSRRGEGRRAWRWPLLYAAFLLALTGIRLAYYGAPLPNTFYAKTGDPLLRFGVFYAETFLRDGVGWLLPLGALAVWREARTRPTAVYSLATFAYVIWVGGDPLGHGRLLVPVLPCLAALAVCGASHAAAAGRLPALAAVGCLVTAALAQGVGWPPGLEALRRPKRAAQLEIVREFDRSIELRARILAGRLRTRREPPRLLATAGIGAIGYFIRVPILDLVGLVDPVIARSPVGEQFVGEQFAWPGHRRANTAYVFSRRPDYIAIERKGESSFLTSHVPAMREILEHPDLERLYEWDEWLRVYRLRDAGGSSSPASGG